MIAATGLYRGNGASTLNPLSRRHFFLSGARNAAALTAVAATSQGAPASDRVNLAVIGTGGRGTSAISQALELGTATVAAVCDVDANATERASQMVYKSTNKAPRSVSDFRRLLEDKSIDAFMIATPHHWHSPIAVAAMKAGKDVYVEKPASHVFREGRVLIETSTRYNRIFQHGTQMRSSDVTAKARELLDAGVIGEVKMSKAWNLQRTKALPTVPDAAPPPGVDYDLWQGPAPRRPFNPGRFNRAVNWNNRRDYGNGNIGGDGIHDLDMAHFGLSPKTHPVRITAHGSNVDGGVGEFPDNMTVSYHFAEGKVLLYEERGWTPYGHYGVDSGNAFYGTEGFMVFSRRGFFQVYLGRKEEPGPAMKGSGGHPKHFGDFLDSVRTRKPTIAPAEVAHHSCALVHLGEIAYRVGRVVHFDPAKEIIVNDPEANALLTKRYTAPFSV
ncbi:MAG: Gfo/Idh/MocA family oxidoreductase [Acidobacteria bacterium]|nr:Gfo/Idh/MocA family oxidoreductase [Acidobacteriota bacterium]